MQNELVITADIHIALVYDIIAKILPKELGFLNPNDEFRKLVKELRPNQKLVMNGDLVDSFYANYRDDKLTNWELFYEILGGCDNDYFLNVGNHDYRRSPSNLSFASLVHLNIDHRTLKKYKKELGYSSFRYFGEWRSLQTVSFDLLAAQGLSSHYYQNIGKRKLLFLDTSKDILFNKATFRMLTKLNSLSTETPQLKGLNRAQIDFLNRQLKDPEAEEILIFLHAPVFFSWQTIKPIKLNPQNYPQQLVKEGLDEGIFVKNNWVFLEKLLKSDKNIIVISSHLHFENKYLLNKDSKLLCQATIEEINLSRQDKGQIKFLSTLSLGAIPSEQNRIGYLILNDQKIKYMVTGNYS